MLFTFEINQNRDLILHSRQIYGPLDFLGDIGGLGDALTAIGRIIMLLTTLVTGNPLERYLIKRLFKKDNYEQEQGISFVEKLNSLSKRRPLTIRNSLFDRLSRNKWHQKAL